ncbi:MAG: bifunctional phosphoserine phosphatase/homoserine phosphotransferase ThrH [Gammaproteobacteria bacterium]|jgi:phosphoserine/homoserine phosphotransferase
MEIACLDLEGVLIPEIWIAFADLTGIPELRITTRDLPDYDVLMKQRLRILAEHGLGLKEIQAVVATMQPLPGAVEFVNWLRQHFQVVILSDTFYEFAMPFMPMLGNPTLLCHKLVVDAQGRVVDYVIRQQDPKRQAVLALQGLNYRVLAAGDSYNDTSMLGTADAGFLFHAPDKVIAEFPQFAAVDTYQELQQLFRKHSERRIA